MVAVEQGQERGLGSRGPLHTAEAHGLDAVLEILQGHREILGPDGGPLADRRGLGRLVVGESQHRQLLPGVREGSECEYDLRNLAGDHGQGVAEDDQFRVAVDELAGRAQMNDAARLRGLIAQSVHMGHHVVAKLGLVGLRRVEVEVVQVCFEGGDLRVGDVEAQRLFALGEGEPESSPGREAVPVGPEFLHGTGGVPGLQRRLVSIAGFHGSWAPGA